MTPSKQPLRILIVDDEKPARNRLREVLSDIAPAQPLVITGEAANGIEALGILEQGGVDLVLLDIRMPEMDGIELAQHMQNLDTPPAIVFTTAYEDYAIKAFELNAVDYLLKPIRSERLAAAISKARVLAATDLQTLQQATARPRGHLSINERGRILLIPVDEIIYLKAELKYVTVRTAEREFLLEESLTRLEQEFASRFVRIHRNCLVSRQHVAGFEKMEVRDEKGETHLNWVVLLKGLDETLPLSRRQHQVMREFAA
jgi:two-component system response regulator AlgR